MPLAYVGYSLARRERIPVISDNSTLNRPSVLLSGIRQKKGAMQSIGHMTTKSNSVPIVTDANDCMILSVSDRRLIGACRAPCGVDFRNKIYGELS